MPKRNKIIFITTNAYPCVVGGLEIFNHYLIEELSKLYPMKVLTTCDKISYPNCETQLIKERKFLKVSQPLSIFLFVLKNRKSIDLLHVSYSKGFWTHWIVYVLIKRMLGIKYMMTIHGGGLTKWYPKWPFKLFFKNATVITGVSDRIINEYEKRSGRDVIYTPPLVPFRIIETKNKYRDKWSVKSTDFVLLYVGSIKPLKATDSFIEALGLISKETINKHRLKVLIAGDGVLKKTLEERVVALDLSENVRFLGNIKTEEIPELYNLADMYTICSEFEGLPISLLEAFANELPCITSNAPGLQNLSENNENSILFKTRDVEEYAKKIQLLLEDDALRAKLKKNVTVYYKNNFSYDTLLDSFKNIIDNI